MPRNDDPTPLYLLSQAVNEYLGTLSPEESPWAEVGVVPSAGIYLADQLVSSGNYFTCYACAQTARLLEVRGGGLEERRARYATVLGAAKKSSSTLRLAGLHGSSAKDMGWIREGFYEDWAFPPTGKKVRSALECARDGEDELCAAAAARMLDELDLYVSLRDGTSDLLPMEQREAPLSARVLWCYRRLLPIWVLTQCAHASAGGVGMPLNIYDLGFWTCAPEGATSPVLELVGRLCAHFELDPLARGDEVSEFVRRARLAFELCSDLADEAEEYREAAWSRDLPSVRELLRARLEGRLRVPRWAMARARLMELILVASFVGIGAALRGDEEAATGSWLDEAGTRMSGAKLGRGSGVVPLALMDSVSDLAVRSAVIDLGPAVEDGPVALFGSAYASGHWVLWRSRAKELLGRFFSPAFHLDADDPGSLLSRVLEATAPYAPDARGLGRFLQLGVVSSGELDTLGSLRGIVAEELESCLRASLGDAGHTPQLTRGAQEDGGADTLVGAARRAAERFNDLLLCAWREQRERTGRPVDGVSYPPSVKGPLFEGLRGAVASYYGEQRCRFVHETVPLERSRSRLLALVGGLEEKYEEECGSDPSMRFLASALRSSLYRELSASHSAPIRLDEVEAVVDEAFDAYGAAERERFYALSGSGVSRRHALLYLDGGELRLVDCGSTYGTAVVRGRLPGGARVLRGSGRTDLTHILGTSWVGEGAEVADTSDVYRADVVRLAGVSAVRVG